METFYIKGGRTLDGNCPIPTAKNALLPILAGSIMCEGQVLLHNFTWLIDVEYMCKILTSLGCKLVYDREAVLIDAMPADKHYIKEEYTKKIRSSIFMLGPMLSRFKRAKVAYPGGCNIGARPIDLHIKGLKALNVKIEEKHGYIYCNGENMRAGEIHLDFPSVGATENLMMASVLLRGTTTIYNCAREPEIEDLQNFLNAMGADVSGAGTSTIVIRGVKKLSGCEYTPITDRIICGTYLIACAMAGGHVVLSGSPREHNLALLSKLKQAGARIKYHKNDIELSASGRLKSLASIDTQPYPGFPTDLQSQILTLQSISKGTSVITENLFETRFKICTELIKMGADITIKDRMAIVKGVPKLYGANVIASDLRGGAGLILAGISAEGYTTVEDIHHIDRGYFRIEDDLSRLNVDIVRKVTL